MHRFIYILLITGLVFRLYGDSTSPYGSTALPDTIVPDDRVIHNIDVNIHNAPGEPSYWKTMARDLIFLREGEYFSSQSLASSLYALGISRQFKTIRTDSSGDRHSLSLSFDLEPFLIIRKIIVKHNFPLFESEVLKAMSVSTGSVYTPEIIEKQISLIQRLYKREGYYDATSRITAREYPDKGYVDLTVIVEKGSPFILRSIKIVGNAAFSDAQLKVRMNTWRDRILSFSSWRFVEKSISEDVKRLTAFYRKTNGRKRFPECIIRDSTLIDSIQKEAVAFITITEGPRYKIKYRKPDNTKLKSEIKRIKRKLRKQLIIYDKGNRNDLGLRKSMQNMKRFYKNHGYRRARIHFTDNTLVKRHYAERHVIFIIDEGARTTISAIDIKGNRAFTPERIRKQILSEAGKPFTEEKYRKDIQAIESLYRSYGYRNATVSDTLIFNTNSTSVAATITINEGLQTVISSVSFDSVTAVQAQKVRRAVRVKEGDPYQRPLIKSDEIALSALIAEKGYPYVKVGSSLDMGRDSSSASLRYSIDEGPTTYLGRIYYTGNFRTKERMMQREIGLKPGRPFSLQKMLEGQKNLRNMNIFNSVSYKVTGLKEKNDTVNLFIEIEEKRPYFTQFGIGYEYDLFWGDAKVGDHNFLGLNKDISVSARATQVGGYRFDLCLIQYRLFGFHTKNITELYYEKILGKNQTFGAIAFGASIGVTRNITRHLNLNGSIAFERRDQFGEVDTSSPEEFEPRNLITLKPALTFDRRDSFTRPKKGLFSTLSISLSKGLASSLDDFIKYRYELRYYWTPVKAVTLATALRLGYLDPLGDNPSVPQDQLFFLGGTRDVRGFNENELRVDENNDPVGGEVALSGSIEPRINIGSHFEIPLFYDIGRIDDSFAIKKAEEELRHSAGLGLRYITPIGPIGLLYGFKLNGKENARDIGRFHFSLGYTF